MCALKEDPAFSLSVIRTQKSLSPDHQSTLNRSRALIRKPEDQALLKTTASYQTVALCVAYQRSLTRYCTVDRLSSMVLKDAEYDVVIAGGAPLFYFSDQV